MTDANLSDLPFGHINRIAAEEDIPGCWACTLLRISLRLQWVALLGGWGLGFVTALCVARIWGSL